MKKVLQFTYGLFLYIFYCILRLTLYCLFLGIAQILEFVSFILELYSHVKEGNTVKFESFLIRYDYDIPERFFSFIDKFSIKGFI